MPRGDRTGPWGAGPMTGRGAGYCAGYSAPGFTSEPFGFWGARAPWCGRRGWRHWFYATGLPLWARGRFPSPSPDQEREALKAQATWMNEMLKSINKRIEELESK